VATSNVSIANLALAHLGDDASISSLDPPEGSAQAEHCQQFLPIARDTLLEMHPWKFAVRRAVPAQLSLTYTAWSHVYAEPNDCLRILAVLPEGYTDDVLDTVLYETESDEDNGSLILTNTPVASVRYISRVDNPAKFTPLFTDCLAWLLASYVAGPLLKGETGQAAARTAYATFLTQYAAAARVNASQGKTRPAHTPGWIAARG
jgi:hypothetical protein